MAHRKYNIRDIQKIVGGSVIAFHDDLPIENLLIDSRKITQADNSVFFAIQGDRHDGHLFLNEVYLSGVRNFIVSKDIEIASFSNSNILKVTDAVEALQTLTAYHRKQYKFPVIGITGSNGKTIVKEWLYQLLRKSKRIVRSPKSYNSQIGVPLSVWLCEDDYDLGIFEAGISHAGEMSALKRMIEPSIGVFTNIGQAHDENFDHWEDKVEEKIKLFYNCEVLIYCKDYKAVHKVVQEHEIVKTIPTFTWSRTSRANLQIGKIQKQEGFSTIQAVYNNNFVSLQIPFSDEASVENAIHCWTVMLYMGYEQEVIAERMLLLAPVAMRLELNAGINNCTIINDTYNSDLGSLSIALDFIHQQKHHDKKTVILSDILQSGQEGKELYDHVASLLKEKNISRVIGVGEAISAQRGSFAPIQAEFFADTAAFLKSFDSSHFQNETILLKGARAFGFEQISKIFQQKIHETIVEVNLNALIHNLNFFRSKLAPTTKVMAMVKALSYGSGSYEIAQILEFHRIGYLGVAYIDEGVELRKAGINVPIMIMNPQLQGYDTMIHYHLEPEIYSFRTFEAFETAVNRNLKDNDAPYPIHIKLDTGMHRLGFEDKDLNELIIKIKNNKKIKVQSIFSHLSSSDDLKESAFTRGQIDSFQKMSDKIMARFNYSILRHILNSSGIFNYPYGQFEMVRLGIGLYGVASDPGYQDKLMPVSTVKTTISQIKKIPAGDSIGYNRKEIAKQEMIIATVPIGYADGLSRKLSNRKGKMVVHGKLAPIVGNVCMDMTMIDITEIPAEEGDEVIVFGEGYPVTEYAKDMGTIPYEALTSIAGRVKRVYYQE
ncbi:MAG: bifunctional UDP-N-acetylmuramoyl-tripeptide:D-alanyl-D-alanine ligase/alanine racemase [Bacteroidetes bacterium]|nr:bifunctional UDP-N-acetylmuramoyl-tripeptide:D-alanyl-D-alanine ligase/alanine racemase [Bacteroidota bacterium]